MFAQIAAVVFVLVLIKIYAKATTGWCKSHVCLKGKTVIITGANQGIGYETALDLAKRGARVILACRNREKAEAARQNIIKETNNEDIVVKIIDCCSFESIRRFAKDIIDTEERLDILINNAGVGEMDGSKKTKDGHCLVTQVNYYSTFLLTNLLVDFMKKSGNGRILNTSSVLANFALDLRPNRLDTSSGTPLEYTYTKLCTILFTQELGRRLEGTGVTTYSLHPGVVDTDIFQNCSPFAILAVSLIRYAFKTRLEGAQTTIYCAVQQGIEKYSGEHFSDCRRISPCWNARNPKLAREIWDKTQAIVEKSLP